MAKRRDTTTSKEDVQLAMVRWESASSIIKHSGTVLCGAFSVYCIMTGLAEIVKSNPESVSALAAVVKALDLKTWLPYIGWGVTGAAWMVTNQMRKRAIRKKAALQKLVDGNDPGRTSSGLTPSGDTP